MNKPELRITNILNNDVIATSCQEVFGLAYYVGDKKYAWVKNNYPIEQYIENYRNDHGGQLDLDIVAQQLVHDGFAGYGTANINPKTPYHVNNKGEIIGPCHHTSIKDAIGAHGIPAL